MKLRNKETGEIFRIASVKHVESGEPNGYGDYPIEFIVVEGIDEEGYVYEFRYKSLKDLNKMWEDYEPTEPLIKDEKIRKAVRAWADVTGTTSVCYWGAGLESEQNDSKIGFDDLVVVEFGDNYTIAELCGEEEE